MDVTPIWLPAGCLTSSAVGWTSIAATSAEAGSAIAETTGLLSDVRLRFGVTAPSDGLGRYVAPITFDVIAVTIPV